MLEGSGAPVAAAVVMDTLSSKFPTCPGVLLVNVRIAAVGPETVTNRLLIMPSVSSPLARLNV